MNEDERESVRDMFNVVLKDELAIESQGMKWMIDTMKAANRTPEFILNIIIARLEANIAQSPEAAYEMRKAISEDIHNRKKI